MKRKKRQPIAYVTEGIGPRLNEITRWTYADPKSQGRKWLVIVYINPHNAHELIYETGPLLGGHWGHDGGGTSQRVAAFLSSLSAPSWTSAPPEALRKIATTLKQRTQELECQLANFLSSAKNRNMYEHWVLYEKLTSLTNLGKYGDEFSGLLVGAHHKDGRLLLFQDEDTNPRVIVSVGYSEAVLAEFTSVAEMQSYLAKDAIG